MSAWQDITENFPWKDLTLGLIIPKVIFLVGISRNELFAGGCAALAWCLAVFWFNHVRARNVNIFAVLTVVMIIVRIVVVLASRSSALYLFVQALDSALYGVIFLASLGARRSIIQLFVEASSVRIPDDIRRSPYYAYAWRIITAAWGGAYLVMAVILVLLKVNDLALVAVIDMVSGWPLTTVLILFTIRFPRWYWAVKIPIRST